MILKVILGHGTWVKIINYNRNRNDNNNIL